MSISYNFKDGGPYVVITMRDTNTGEVTNSDESLNGNHPESKHCFICGEPLTGDYGTYTGIGDYCFKCSKDAEEYANALRGRGFHGPR